LPPLPLVNEEDSSTSGSACRPNASAAVTLKPSPRPPPPVQRITAEQIRELREHIRHRYALDIEIWRQRNVKEYKRKKLIENMRRSDAALEVIRRTLQDWDRREYFASDLKHQKFAEIKDRLLNGVKANWAKHPPWDLAQKGGNPYLGPGEKYGRPVNGPPVPITQTPMASAPQSQAPAQQYVPFRPANRGLRHAGEIPRPINGAPKPNNGVHHPVLEGYRRSIAVRQLKPRGPPPPPPVEVPSSPSIRAPTPFDGNGTPVLAPPESNTGSRRATWKDEGRIVGPQWQHDPVDYDRQ
jgi:hypothetical protein